MRKLLVLCSALLLASSAALAADMPTKAPAPSPYSNSGLYGGINLMGNLDGSTNGGGIGGQFGYQFWWPASNVFMAGEVFGNFLTQANGAGAGYSDTYMFGELVKVGLGLSGLLPGATSATSAPSQAPVPVSLPSALSAATAAPYLTMGAVETGVPGGMVTGWAGGTGIDWAVAAHVNIDLMYLYVDYNTPRRPNDNVFKLSLNYKL
jgi:opacity protein-like surface antigen